MTAGAQGTGGVAPGGGARPGAWSAAALAFGASAAVLVLEIIAGRMLAPYVGVSLETFTGIIGTCLAGIAVGAAAGGALADRSDPVRLRRLLAWALLLAGGSTWTAVPVVAALGPALGSGPVAIVVLTAAAFGGPIVVLSAVAPMVAKLRLARLEETGRVVGRLSAAGTLGALAGSFLTGFVAVAVLASTTVVLLTGAGLVVAGAVVAWRSGRRRPSALASVVLVALAGGVAVTGTPCGYETRYFCARVVTDDADPSVRHLELDRLRHASVDLDDPAALPIRYTRLFGAVAASLPAGPVDALHIGGGGFSFPRHLAAVRPGSTSRVLELDGDLVGIAREHLDLRTGPRLSVRVGDARLALGRDRSDRYDLVVGDAFGGEAVPWHLTTAEVATEVRRLLRDDGVYVMNVIDGGRNGFARAQAATLAEVFDHVGVVVPVGGVPADRSVNQVLVASDSPLVVPAIGDGDGRWLGPAELRRYVDGARVLTDDRAPVDQLIRR